MRAIIIDDELASLRSLKYEIESYCTDVEVVATVSDSQVAYSIVMNEKPDVVFLDIEMPILNGFDLLMQFDSIPFCIVFVTAYNEFAIRAFEFNAVDYLLKPVLKPKLQEAIKRVKDRLGAGLDMQTLKVLMNHMHLDNSPVPRNTFAIPTSEGYEFIALNDISHLIAESNYTWLHMQTGEKYLISKTLKQVSAMIAQDYFFRTHKSYVVNLEAVKKYVRGRGGYLVMKDGSQVPVSRNHKLRLMELIEG